jgi:hypothetical protein
MAGLRAWQQTKEDDCFSRRVHSAIPATRVTERFRTHPTLRLYGQRSSIRLHGTLSAIVGNGTHCSVTGRLLNAFGMVLSRLSSSDDFRSEIECGADCMAFPYPSPARYVLVSMPHRSRWTCNRTPAPTCLQLSNRTLSSFIQATNIQAKRDRNRHFRIRCEPLPLQPSRPVTTPTRILVLSPYPTASAANTRPLPSNGVIESAAAVLVTPTFQLCTSDER